MSTKKEHTVKRILSEKIEELKASQNTRLDEIEKFVKAELVKINERNRGVNSYVVGINTNMQQKLYNMELTNDALKAILEESGLVPDLKEKLTAKRAELHEQYSKEAEEAMKAKMEQQEKAEQAPAAAEAAPAQPVEEIKQEQAQG